MKPGPELDRLVAERVMGWTRGIPGDPEGWADVDGCATGWVDISTGARASGPRSRRWRSWAWTIPPSGYEDLGGWMPSTNILPAWKVVGRLIQRGWGFDISVRHDSCRVDAWGLGTGVFRATEATAPHAICLAALQALSGVRP